MSTEEAAPLVALKACSCGIAGCPELGPHGEHDWNPLAEPVDDCVLCGGSLQVLPTVQSCRMRHAPPPVGPPRAPARLGSGYAHGECV